MARDRATFRWAIDKFLEYAPSILGSGAAVFAAIWAFLSDRIHEIGIFTTALVVVIGFFVTYILSLIIRYLSALTESRRALAEYENKLSAGPYSINPLEGEFSKKIISLRDLSVPHRPILRHKKFIECDIMGPGALAIMNMNSFEFTNFNGCDIVVVPEKTPILSATGLENCAFLRCNLYGITLFVNSHIAETMKKNLPNLIVIGAEN